MAKPYILVVDDEPDLVETLATMLESKGVEVDAPMTAWKQKS